ncbi:MAG: 3'-5' exonuclease, partial [Pseudomonadota bacterium]
KLVEQFANHTALNDKIDQIKYKSAHHKRYSRCDIWPVLLQDRHQPNEHQYEKFDRPRDLLCHLIARQIKSMIGKTWLESQSRYAQPKDFMILVCDRKPLMMPLIRALNEHQLPVFTNHEPYLLEQPVIIDLMSLLRFLALPQDQLSLAETLRSPFVGIDEQDLEALCTSNPKADAQFLLQALKKHPSFENIYHWIKQLLHCAHHLPVFDLIRQCLDRPCPGPVFNHHQDNKNTPLSARKALAMRFGNDIHHALTSFCDFAFKYTNEQSGSLGEFIEFAFEMFDELVLSPIKDNQARYVKVVTVHFAKGSQAPIVILPEDHHSSSHPQELLQKLENQHGQQILLCKPPKTKYNAFKDYENFEKTQNQYESNRQCYVAMTRAIDRLMVMACADKTKTYKGPPQHSWYYKISSAMKNLETHRHEKKPFEVSGSFEWYESGLSFESNILNPESESKKQDLTKKQIKINWPSWVHQKASPPSSEKEYTPSNIYIAKNQNTSFAVTQPSSDQKKQKNAVLNGQLTHKLLEYLPEYASPTRFERARLIAHHFAKKLPKKIIDQTIKSTLELLQNPSYEFIFSSKSHAEVKFKSRIEWPVEWPNESNDVSFDHLDIEHKNVKTHLQTFTGQVDRMI